MDQKTHDQTFPVKNGVTKKKKKHKNKPIKETNIVTKFSYKQHLIDPINTSDRSSGKSHRKTEGWPLP